MTLILMLLISAVPFLLGISIFILFEKTRLNLVLAGFFILICLWQVDSAVLYAGQWLSLSAIEPLFRFFRFAQIMMGPTLYFIACVISRDTSDGVQSVWHRLANSKISRIFFLWSLVVYAINWSPLGITKLYFINRTNSTRFLYPSFGPWEWTFTLQLALLALSIIAVIMNCIGIHDKDKRKFMLTFIVSTLVGFSIGVLNTIPSLSSLMFSGVAVLLQSIFVFSAFIHFQAQIVRSVNKALTAQKNFLSEIINAIPHYVYAKDSEGLFTLSNAAYAKALGTAPGNLIGRSETDFNPHVEELEVRLRDEFDVMTASLKHVHSEERFTDENGESRWYQFVRIPLASEERTQLLCLANDITERKWNEEQIRYLAYHDHLTSLPNRLSFAERTAKELIQALMNDQVVAVILLDLDRFKNINDTLGHRVGDSLLQTMAQRLNHCVKGRGTVYRLGGDEFVIVLQNEDGVQMAHAVLETISHSFRVREHEVFVTASIGISIFPSDGNNVDDLFVRADSAMYAAKEQGGNDFKFYSPTMSKIFSEKLVLESRLHKALEREEFFLQYQPKIDVGTNKIQGMEALIRWEQPELGRVGPTDFIPIAEETGLIILIGEWVMRTACRQNKTWQDEGLPCMRMSVNCSVRQLKQKDLACQISRILQETGLDGKWLEIEITEGALVLNEDATIRMLDAIRAQGVKISIDDFGTGYSSLSYLKRLPVDTIKIDRSFLQDFHEHSEDAAIIRTIITLAHSLNLEVVAEGVETEGQLAFLRREKCDTVQGYLLGRPLSLAAFENLLRLLAT